MGDSKHLYDLLVRDGYRVSFDIDTLRCGDFNVQLLERIEQCKDFLLIVDPHAFDRSLDPSVDPRTDWLRSELAYALEKNKNVIPVFLSGINGFPDNLPDDIAAVTLKNGPEYNRYHFNSFYEILKKRFLHVPIKIRIKRIIGITISVLAITLLSIGIVTHLVGRMASTGQGVKPKDEEEAVTKVDTTAQQAEIDRKTQLKEQFKKMAELEVSQRADIVDVIKTFLKDFASDRNAGWYVFSDYTQNRQFVPLSDGLEGDDVMPFKLEFMAKLVYKGKNLDSDIFGRSQVQDIYLGGPHARPMLLAISTDFPSIAECDIIIKDTGFKKAGSKIINLIGYDIYQNKSGWWLVLITSGGSGGNSYEWIVSFDPSDITRYLRRHYYLPSEEDVFK